MNDGHTPTHLSFSTDRLKKKEPVFVSSLSLQGMVLKFKRYFADSCGTSHWTGKNNRVCSLEHSLVNIVCWFQYQLPKRELNMNLKRNLFQSSECVNRDGLRGGPAEKLAGTPTYKKF